MADVRILTTGGSIDKVYSPKGRLETGPPAAHWILDSIGLPSPFELEAVCAKDSLDLDDDDRAAIRSAVERATEARILITHGTDTMVTTAEALRGIVGKVVVLTGAMQPASMRDSDAAFNLGLAFGAAQLVAPGVYIAMSGRLFPAETVQKDRDAGVFREVDAEPPAADRP